MSTILTLPISGLKCDGCVRSLTKALQASPSIEEVSVNLEPPQARITFGTTPLSVEETIKLIHKAGFDSP